GSVPSFRLVFLFGGVELEQVVYAFAVTGATALTLGFIGIAFSTLFRRTLPATVAAYGAAFVLFVGFFAYGYVFPTEADPSVTIAPAPPAVTLISPVVPLLTIASNQPIQGYGIRYKDGSQGPYRNKGVPGQAGLCAPTGSGGGLESRGGDRGQVFPARARPALRGDRRPDCVRGGCRRVDRRSSRVDEADAHGRRPAGTQGASLHRLGAPRPRRPDGRGAAAGRPGEGGPHAPGGGLSGRSAARP